MSFKLNRYHRNYLYWIYPLIFVGLTIYAIKEDQLDEKSASRANSIVYFDSSLIMSIQIRVVDSLGVTDYRDSTLTYYDLNK
jgi:hypothetical protein